MNQINSSLKPLPPSTNTILYNSNKSIEKLKEDVQEDKRKHIIEGDFYYTYKQII